MSTPIQEQLVTLQTPLIPPSATKKAQDWIKIAAIVGAVVFGLIAVFAALCVTKQFPPAFLGGQISSGCIAAIFGILFAGSGVTVWIRHRKPQEALPKPTQETPPDITQETPQ